MSNALKTPPTGQAYQAPGTLPSARQALPIPLPWPIRPVVNETLFLARRILAYRAILLAVTRADLHKRYAGSFLGVLWYPLYWATLLAMYSFVYIVIFRQRLPDFGNFGYVLFIFSGLIPYFGVSDAIGSGTGSVRANMTYFRNAVFPVELIPVKTLLVAIVSQSVAVAFLVLLAIGAGYTGLHLAYLPVPFVLEFFFLAGLVWTLSALNMLIPDVQQVVTLVTWLFVFISPIGFTISQVPPGFKWVVWLNPLAYLIEEFRYALLGVRTLSAPLSIGVLVALSALTFSLGATIFRRLQRVFSDYE